MYCTFIIYIKVKKDEEKLNSKNTKVGKTELHAAENLTNGLIHNLEEVEKLEQKETSRKVDPKIEKQAEELTNKVAEKLEAKILKEIPKIDVKKQQKAMEMAISLSEIMRERVKSKLEASLKDVANEREATAAADKLTEQITSHYKDKFYK